MYTLPCYCISEQQTLEQRIWSVFEAAYQGSLPGVQVHLGESKNQVTRKMSNYTLLPNGEYYYDNPKIQFTNGVVSLIQNNYSTQEYPIEAFPLLGRNKDPKAKVRSYEIKAPGWFKPTYYLYIAPNGEQTAITIVQSN